MSVDFQKAKFVRPIRWVKHAPPPRPSVVFAGKSNVGKSTLLNSLVKKKGLAKTSGTPGRTQEIIYFDIDGKYYFIDLPGFGYAKAPKKVQEQWRPMIEKFLRNAEGIDLVVILLDARREPDDQVRQLIEWLEEIGRAYIFVVTKIDKVKKAQVAKRIREIGKSLGIEAEDALIPFSAQTGQGRRELLHVIEQTLGKSLAGK